MTFHKKTIMDEEPLRIRFDKVEGFIKILYLVLFGPGWHDAIYNRIGYLISEKVVLQIIK